MSADKAKVEPKLAADGEAAEGKPFCGIIMPIASMPGYESSHWSRVRAVLDRAVVDAGYVPRMVSESEDIGVIHGRIVQNLYDDPIVVCDVSAKNANVMFELGLRLAFDKPTIIVKDEETGYSFDTSPIKHIGYRKDQRFDDVERFQSELTAAIRATIEAKRKDSGYSPFLSHFGKFTPKTIESKEVPQVEFMMNKLHDISLQLDRMSSHYINDADIADSLRGRGYSGDLSTNALREIVTSALVEHVNSKDSFTASDRDAMRKKILERLRMRGVAIPERDLDGVIRRTWEEYQKQRASKI